jgi:hypothetical protein
MGGLTIHQKEIFLSNLPSIQMEEGNLNFY